MKKIITLVGTSIFTKNKKKVSEKLEEKAKMYLKNQVESQSFLKKINEAKLKIENLTSNNCCAEVASILKFIEGNNLNNEDIKVYLLASDTIASVLAAEKIKKVLKETHSIEVEFEKEYGKGVIENLRVDNLEDFEDGIDNLIKRVIEIASDGESVEKKHFDDVVFNITGGYKGVVAYLAILGEIVGSEIIYMFEDSNELLLLPKLPVGIKDEYEDLLFPYLNDFIIDEILNKKGNVKVAEKLEELKFIRKINGKYKLTELGKLFKSVKSGENLLGGLMEFVVLEWFSRRYKVRRSVKDKKNLEIDVFVEKKINSNEVEIELIEVKSLNQVDKFLNKQFDKYLKFILDDEKLKKILNEQKEKDFTIKNKSLSVVIFLPDKKLLEVWKVGDKKYIDAFKEKKEALKEKNIDFKVYYIELPYEKLKNFIEESKYKLKEFQID